jgi:phosphatidate phosphatase PAH1
MSPASAALLSVGPLGLLGLVGCGGEKDEDSASPCRRAVVTDIDETLTIADEELLKQIADPTYDPAMRPDADALMRGYADRGYTILYVTARWDGISLSDGRSATRATTDWLDLHDFPWAPEDVYLASQIVITNEATIAYKKSVLDARAGEGWAVDWGYGNATTDIDAFLQGGVDASHLFLVGELAGSMDVNAIPDDDAYSAHMAEQLPLVPTLDCASP